MPLTYIAGLSGSGKSTITEVLRQQGREAHDADVELCKWFDNNTGEEVSYPHEKADREADWQDHHTFRMSEQGIAELANKAKDGTIYVLGIAPNDLELASKYFKKVYFLYTSEAAMVDRITKRTNNKYGHDADQLAIIAEWYQPTVDKYRKYGAQFIDAEQPIDMVVKELVGIGDK